MTTRELRLWHWRKVSYWRTVEREHAERAKAWESRNPELGRCRYSRCKEQNAKTNALFHLGAVQALNDCPDCLATTAEQDHELFPVPHSRRKK